MPFRALVWMVISIALALLTVSLWLGAIRPLLLNLPAPVATTQSSTSPAATVDQSATALRSLIRAVLLLSFVLITLLLLVGLIATYRELLRARSLGRRFSSSPAKTPYTDIWKLAGRRAELPPANEDSPHETGNDEDGAPSR